MTAEANTAKELEEKTKVIAHLTKTLASARERLEMQAGLSRPSPGKAPRVKAVPAAAG
jgi:hypothetical protein